MESINHLYRQLRQTLLTLTDETRKQNVLESSAEQHTVWPRPCVRSGIPVIVFTDDDDSPFPHILFLILPAILPAAACIHSLVAHPHDRGTSYALVDRLHDKGISIYTRGFQLRWTPNYHCRTSPDTKERNANISDQASVSAECWPI